ncbi:DUF559 domain-containing protein [Methylobacterium sp. Leaf108]|uniref:endonuclease domain-containing protein n=1 Tax=Methylobacterium sp. Leaf108 TaxID=1736256 RepID=UPI003299E84D
MRFRRNWRRCRPEAMRSADEERTECRRRLRHDHTDVETRSWRRLRNRQFGGFKSVRREGIGPSGADFCRREVEVVVELNGSQPVDRSRDTSRNAYPTRLGYRVLRFRNAGTKDDIAGVLDTIAAPLPPSPRSWGEDVGLLIGAGVSPKGEAEGTIPEKPHPKAPPHPRLPPRLADDEVGQALSPRAGRGGEPS